MPDGPDPPPASLWPTWRYSIYLAHEQGGRLHHRMPFDPLFWRAAQRGDATHSWNLGADAGAAKAPTSAPTKVRGFIVTFPTNWTRRENNLSIASHLGALAHNLAPNAPQDGALVARAEPEGRPSVPHKEVLG